MIDDMINNKNLNAIVVKLFIRGQKLKITYVFIKFYFQMLMTETR